MKIIFVVFAIGMSFCVGMVFQGMKAKQLAGERGRATGIGGIFFKSENPAKLSAWYATHLGVTLREGAGAGEPPIFEWREKENPKKIGVTVWSPFPNKTKYFEPSHASFMINYRVNNLDAILRQLRAAGVQVDEKISDDANGRFGWAMDPEGNRFELWEPK